MSADAMSPAGIIRLQMTALPGKAHLRLVNLTTDVSQASLKSLRLGLITLKDIPMAALDVPAFLSRAPHPDAPAGWLGTPFLSAFQVTIDSAQRLVLLESPGAKPPTGHGVTTVPVQIKDGRPYISVSLPGAKPFSALIGTGVVLTMIPRAAAQKAGLKAVETLPVTGTDGKPGKIALALLPRLLVGKAEVKSMRIAYLAADSPDALDPELAVLGMDFLSRFRATLNIDKKRLYLTPAAQSDSAAPAAPAPKPSSRSAGRR
jgi:predicted aspartyl protease